MALAKSLLQFNMLNVAVFVLITEGKPAAKHQIWLQFENLLKPNLSSWLPARPMIVLIFYFISTKLLRKRCEWFMCNCTCVEDRQKPWWTLVNLRCMQFKLLFKIMAAETERDLLWVYRWFYGAVYINLRAKLIFMLWMVRCTLILCLPIYV